MVEKARRSKGGEEPRGGDAREWEVFVRDTEDDPLRHVGSVTAPSAEIANEQASRLFAWYATDLWLCPADETRRYSTRSLGDTDDDQATSNDGSEPTAPDGTPEPRTHEL